MYTKLCAEESDTLALAAKLANCIEMGAVIYLVGDLGAGKTTFSRGFLRGMGYTEKVKSPTYTLVEPYEIGGRHIFHFDLYRVKDAEELEYIGVHDYFTNDAICLIEWPEQGFPLLPAPDLTCYIAMAGNNREVRIETHSVLGEKILQKLAL